MDYLRKNSSLISIVILFIVCLLLYFPNIGGYPFIDTDETKFVSIAKDMLNYSDWINIKINGENAFDISPLFFWITNLSCLLFGKISSETVRLPISIISAIGIIFLYISIKKILRKTYSFIISLIMATCLGTVVFSRLATNDFIFVITTMAAILFSYLAIFTNEDKSKTKYWIGTYIFCALSILCSGLFGFFIVFFSVLAMHIFAGKLKEIFIPKNLIIGLLIFAILLLPWHLIMIYKYGIPFVKEYLFIYNLINYISIKNILIVIGFFILGFSPWSFSFLWILGSKAKDILTSIFSYFKDNSEEKLKEKWNNLSKIDKFLSLNTIVFFTSLILALLYGSKYTFLILFLMFPASCISGHYWYEYMIRKEHDRSIFFATMIPNLIFIICSLLGLFGHNIINKWLFQGLSHLILPLIIIFFIIPVISIFSVILRSRIVPYAANIILMLSLSFVITPTIFNFIALNGGENDLISFAQIANKDNAPLTAFIPAKKYSLIYYYDKPITFHNNKDFDWLEKYLKENPYTYVVVEIKDMWDIEAKNIKYMLLDSGKRYCLIQHMATSLQEIQEPEENTEPEVIVY